MVTKTTVYLEEETLLTLRQMAAAQKRSQAEIIRAAVGQYARRMARPKLPGLGAFHSGRTDISEKAEVLLRKAARGKRWR
jgi:hypothetical protein